MGLAGISAGQLIMIAFVALLVFGPQRLKTISQELGIALAEFKKSFDNTMNDK
jgi:TatA/E family protein of Tat protein translocase